MFPQEWPFEQHPEKVADAAGLYAGNYGLLFAKCGKINPNNRASRYLFDKKAVKTKIN